jgi:hypothetical protein
MREELEKKIKDVKDEGLKRILIIIKLCLKDTPRLLQEMESTDKGVQKRALEEGRWLLQMINNEIENAHKNKNMSIIELNAALADPSNFTPQEWEAFKGVPQILRKYRHLLVPEKTQKPKLKKLRRFPKV